MSDIRALAKELLAALKRLTSNPHMNLGDLVYDIREREGLGWDGPSVQAWGDAVSGLTPLTERAEKELA